MDITLPSGQEVKGIPEGTSKEDVKAKLLSSGKYTEQDFIEDDYQFNKMVRNIPESAWQFAKDVTAPIHSTGEVYDSVKSLIKGGWSKATGGDSPDEATVDALVEMYKKRYGTIDRAQRTLQNDPVGMLSDVASIFSGGAIGAAKLAGKTGKVGSALDKAGRVVMAADPVNLAINTAKLPLKKAIPKGAPNRWLQSAMKFSTAKFDAAERKQLADTMLKYGIGPNPKGMDLAHDTVIKKGKEISNLVDDMTAEGMYSDLANADANISALRGDLSNKRTNPDYRVETDQLDSLYNPWREEMAAEGDFLSPRELQDIKTNQYEKINWNKGQQTGSQVEKKYRKNLARGAKESLEELAPELKLMNSDLGALMALTRGTNGGQGPLTQSTNRIMNRDISGIGVPIKMATMESIFPGAGAIIGGTWGAMDTPTFKAKAALKADKFKKRKLRDEYMNNGLMGLLGRQAIEELGMFQDYQEDY